MKPRIEQKGSTRPIWDSPYFRPEWKQSLRIVVEGLAPYEALYAEVAQDMQSEDYRALLEILQTSHVIDEPMRAIGTLVGHIERQVFDEFRAAFARGDRRRAMALRAERDKALETIDKTIVSIAKKAPFTHLLLQDGAITQVAMANFNSIIVGQYTVEQAHAVIDQYRDESLGAKGALKNALNILVAQHESAYSDKLVPSENSEVFQYPELYTSIDFAGRASGHIFFDGRKVDYTIELTPDKHPFVMGGLMIQIPYHLPMAFRISRFDGRLLFDGTRVARIGGSFPSPIFERNLEYIVWSIVHKEVSAGRLSEARESRKDNREDYGVEEVVTVTEIDDDVLEEEVYENKNTQELAPSTGNIGDVQVSESVPSHGTRIPALSYRQFTRALMRCGARIVPGGKHLKVEKDGQSTVMFNPHAGSERYFYASEIRQKLEALAIPIETFLEKI